MDSIVCLVIVLKGFYPMKEDDAHGNFNTPMDLENTRSLLSRGVEEYGSLCLEAP